jgi:hypothetical protein
MYGTCLSLTSGVLALTQNWNLDNSDTYPGTVITLRTSSISAKPRLFLGHQQLILPAPYAWLMVYRSLHSSS